MPLLPSARNFRLRLPLPAVVAVLATVAPGMARAAIPAGAEGRLDAKAAQAKEALVAKLLAMWEDLHKHGLGDWLDALGLSHPALVPGAPEEEKSNGSAAAGKLAGKTRWQMGVFPAEEPEYWASCLDLITVEARCEERQVRLIKARNPLKLTKEEEKALGKLDRDDPKVIRVHNDQVILGPAERAQAAVAAAKAALRGGGVPADKVLDALARRVAGWKKVLDDSEKCLNGGRQSYEWPTFNPRDLEAVIHGDALKAYDTWKQSLPAAAAAALPYPRFFAEEKRLRNLEAYHEAQQRPQAPAQAPAQAQPPAQPPAQAPAHAPAPQTRQLDPKLLAARRRNLVAKGQDALLTALGLENVPEHQQSGHVQVPAGSADPSAEPRAGVPPEKDPEHWERCLETVEALVRDVERQQALEAKAGPGVQEVRQAKAKVDPIVRSILQVAQVAPWHNPADEPRLRKVVDAWTAALDQAERGR